MPESVVGDMAPYLLEGMAVQISQFNGVAIALVLPQRATFEVVETEPVTKGQTASSSYKPAVLSNGVRTPQCRRHMPRRHPRGGDDGGWSVCGAGEGFGGAAAGGPVRTIDVSGCSPLYLDLAGAAVHMKFRAVDIAALIRGRRNNAALAISSGSPIRPRGDAADDISTIF